MLTDQLSFFGEGRSYFSEYKARIFAKLAPANAQRILDFGSGIGLMIPFLKEQFPSAQIYATDISATSLQHIADRHPEVCVISDSELDSHQFDAILIATVLHHIEPKLRCGIMSRLAARLTRGGIVCIFEHNPYNPVTRRLVSTCVFDSDAILLPMSESTALVTSTRGLAIARRGYTLFFPNRLAWLRAVEPALYWLPLGGQYFVAVTKLG